MDHKHHANWFYLKYGHIKAQQHLHYLLMQLYKFLLMYHNQSHQQSYLEPHHANDESSNQHQQSLMQYQPNLYEHREWR